MQRIVVDNVSKQFKIGFKKDQSALARAVSFLSGREPKKIIQALDNVSFEVEEGETVGIIGENGSGKTTLLRVIAGIYDKDQGQVLVNGKMISLINLNIGLKERLTMRDNIYLCSSLFGLSKRKTNQRFNSIVEFTELQNFVNTKIYQFSNGMKQRLAFSIAMQADPEILLVDEVLEVGDEDFKEKSSGKLEELIKKGATVLLVSHDLNLIKKHCRRAILMSKGKILKQGYAESVIEAYLNGNNKNQKGSIP